MGNYHTYPDYKSAGSKLLGEIPKDWIVTQVKHVGTLKGGAGFPHSEQGVRNEALNFHKVNALGKANAVGLLENSENTISLETAKRLGAYVFPKGSIVFAKVGAALLLARIRSLKADSCIDNNLMGLVVHSKHDSSFIKYSMNLIKFDYIVNPGAVPSLNEFQMGNLFLPIPDRWVQEKIANFLDHETAKIDTLIEKQQQLINLLKEKRQAVISHAVTKGLNPNAPMRDSGVEWLGEVPEHWVVTKAKFLFNFVTSGSRGWADYYSDDGPLFFRIANLTRDTIQPKLESIQCVNPPFGTEGLRAKIQKDDLLISITADLGSVCVADEEVEGGYVSQHVSLCRPNKEVTSSRWLGYCILSDLAKEQLLGSGYGGTKIQLSLEDIRELWLVQPGSIEQTEMANFIDSELIKFSMLMKRAEDQVILLQERRTALISAAVTGKIDVRNWQAPEPSKTNNNEVTT